jgi:hypothetical protein
MALGGVATGASALIKPEIGRLRRSDRMRVGLWIWPLNFRRFKTVKLMSRSAGFGMVALRCGWPQNERRGVPVYIREALRRGFC